MLRAYRIIIYRLTVPPSLYLHRLLWLLPIIFFINISHASTLTLKNQHAIQFNGQMECGAFDDHALRATFGLEFQIFRCSKMMLGISGQHQYDSPHLWRYKIEWAPLYDSIRREDNGEEIIYGDDGDAATDARRNEAQGQTAYHDWYKNLGTRSYYLGDIPLRDGYVEWLSPRRKNSIRIGRQRNFIALDTTLAPWGDDGKFAPYADWLVRDLYSGVSYGYRGDWLIGNAAVFSGNNPLKGDWYLNGVASPNVKTNNTGTYAVKLGVHPKGKKQQMQFYLGLESNILGSTWAENLGDGKRNNHRQVALWHYQYRTVSGRSLNLLAQRTQYISGLRESSSQANSPDGGDKEKYLDITQEGSYGGFYIEGRKFSYGYIYEEIDRFDYHIFAYDAYALDRQDLKQKSNIYYTSINITPNFKLALAWHNISNPAPEVSEIVTQYNGSPIDYENRFKLVTQFQF